MADVYGRIGSDEVELNNAATEATLKLILTGIKAQSAEARKAINEMAQKMGLDPDTIEQVNTELERGLTTWEKVNVAVDLAQRAFDKLTPVINGFQNAMGAIITSSNNVSDVFKAFSSLPGPLGSIASGFALLNKVQEENFASYQKLTQAGVNFGGDINTLRITANNMGLTFDQLSDLVTKNSEAFAMMGGGTDKAVKSFTAMSTQMIQSPIGDHLRALGYTTEQVNQGMINYIKTSGGRTSKEMENTNQLIESSASYLETLDGLARVTGKSRDQQQQLLDEAAKNAAFQAKLATMDEAEKRKATEGMARALALGGKGAVDAFQSKIMGVAPDKAGAMFIATAGKTAMVVDQLANTALDKSKELDDQKALMVRGIHAAQEDIKKYGTGTVFAISRTGGPLGEALQALGASANIAGKMTDEQIAQALEKGKVDGSAAADAVENQKKMMEMRQALLDALEALRKEFGGDMKTAIVEFARSIKTMADFVKENGELIRKVVIGLTAVWVAWKTAQTAAAIKDVVGSLVGGRGKGGIAGTVAEGVATAGGGAGRGLGIAVAIEEIGLALAGVGALAPEIALGGLALASVIISVGAAIAGATWLVGKTLPTMAEGFNSFTKIDGDKLASTAKGIGALSVALVAFGATSSLSQVGNTFGQIVGGLTKLFGGKDLTGQIVDMANRLGPVAPTLAILGPAMQAYGNGLLAFGAAVGSIDISKADRVTDLMKKPAVSGEIDKLAKQSLNVTASGSSATDQKALQQVMSQLNTVMSEMRRYMQSTSENTGKAVTELRNLQGNLLPHP